MNTDETRIRTRQSEKAAPSLIVLISDVFIRVSSVFIRGQGFSMRSIRPGECDASLARLAGHHALARLRLAVERDAPDGRFRLRLDAILRLARAVPVRHQEAARLDVRRKLVVTVHLRDGLVAILLRPLE